MHTVAVLGEVVPLVKPECGGGQVLLRADVGVGQQHCGDHGLVHTPAPAAWSSGPAHMHTKHGAQGLLSIVHRGDSGETGGGRDERWGGSLTETPFPIGGGISSWMTSWVLPYSAL